MDAETYLPNENLSNDELEDDNTSVSSFRDQLKDPLKGETKSHLRRNKMMMNLLNL